MRPSHPFALTLALALAIPAPAALHAVGPQAPAAPEVPARLHLIPRQVPDELNAALDWVRAASGWERLPSDLMDRLRLPHPLPAAERGPSPVDPGTLQAVLDGRRASWNFLLASLGKPRAQWPPTSPHKPELSFGWLIDVSKVLRHQALDAFSRKDAGAGLEHLTHLIQLAHLVADAEGALIHYLVANAVRQMAHQTVHRIVLDHAPDATVLVRLLDLLPPVDNEPETYARYVRVEFRDYVEKGIDPHKLAEEWAEAFRKEPDLALLLVPESLHRAFRLFLDPTLVARHPAPIDPDARLHRAVAAFTRYIDNAGRPWAAQEPIPVDPEAVEVAFLREAAPILEAAADHPLPLSHAHAAQVAPAYCAFPDPIGRLFEAIEGMRTTLESTVARSFRIRAERNGLRTLLALRLYHARNGSLPRQLDALVESRILPAVPLDPFDDQPYRYDRRRQVIWSIGEDEDDDEADGVRTGSWQDFDYVLALTREALDP